MSSSTTTFEFQVTKGTRQFIDLIPFEATKELKVLKSQILEDHPHWTIESLLFEREKESFINLKELNFSTWDPESQSLNVVLARKNASELPRKKKVPSPTISKPTEIIVQAKAIGEMKMSLLR
eukprot:TRINITY_DN3068_c0_g3_i1.p1 TRINITY_DN3068_c0_g3~~TRINITY_DN3068_c0_g3_i1.p1  ORF type:complete len:123 (+),score=26.33 TRINITY_DN3068_c0_g3_i1:21-389(+)